MRNVVRLPRSPCNSPSHAVNNAKWRRSRVIAKQNCGKFAIQRQIYATDKQIDQLVYELYGLTAKEIRIVEEATRD
jgi:hypothetical protein